MNHNLENLIIKRTGSTGVITLNSQATLNSLNLNMIKGMLDQLILWQNDPKVQCVIIEGAGEKAFCAGGDVVSLYQNIRDFKKYGSPNPTREGYIYEFFKFEYQLDFLIHSYPKPIVALASGIVMGGGIGIMNGAKFRVVTETTKLAMPEITIGLYPDVGGSYFLSRLPDNIGMFLSLTGGRINADDAIYLRLADFFIEKETLPSIKEKIISLPFSENILENSETLRKVLGVAMDESEDTLIEGEVRKNHQSIREITNFDNLKSLHDFWTNNKFDHYSPWIEKSIETYRKGSPTSAIVIFEQMKRGKNLSLQDSFKMEMDLSVNFCHYNDFQEGVRALLIDKDFRPQFEYSDLSSIDDSTKNLIIENHFKSPWELDNHPLKAIPTQEIKGGHYL